MRVDSDPWIVNMIELKNTTYRYGRDSDKSITALTGVNLTIREGESVAVLGPNGSGKSTLARHINGLLVPSEGGVWVDGLSTSNTEEAWIIRQRVGMVFQNPDNQLIAGSVEEDVAFGPENIGIDPVEIKARVKESLEVVEMIGHATFEPHLLSGGQKQRVAIAGALAMRPKYLIFDEATSMLDPKGRTAIINTIMRLNRERGITTVNITHIPEEAVLANRVVVLSGGAVVSDGSPTEVFSDIAVLEAMGINVPKARIIAESLISAGVDLPRTILTIDDLVEALC